MGLRVLPVEKMMELIGEEIALTDWFQVDQDRINKFADCTNDHQWIHVDEAAAAKGPFGKTIAHGYLTISLLPFFGAGNAILPEGAAMGMNYGMNKVRHITPIKVDSKIRDRIVLTDVKQKSGKRLLVTATHTIEIEGADKPACVAEVLSMFFIN